VLASVLVDALGPRPAIAAVGAFLPLLAALTWAATARLDRHATIRARDVELLGQLPMFRGLGPRELEGLVLAVEVVDVAPGTCVIRAGDVGDRFYVIDEGTSGRSRCCAPSRAPPPSPRWPPPRCWPSIATTSSASWPGTGRGGRRPTPPSTRCSPDPARYWSRRKRSTSSAMASADGMTSGSWSWRSSSEVT
jgi:hypothetical protein